MTYSTEILTHFQCDDCKGWWTIGDYHIVAQKTKKLYCPHCGNAQSDAHFTNVSRRTSGDTMIIERTSHETIIATADCKYIAAIAAVEVLYGSEEADAIRYVRFGDVGFNDAINLYPDEFDGFRELLDEVEAYLKKPKRDDHEHQPS